MHELVVFVADTTQHVRYQMKYRMCQHHILELPSSTISPSISSIFTIRCRLIIMALGGGMGDRELYYGNAQDSVTTDSPRDPAIGFYDSHGKVRGSNDTWYS